MKKNQNEDCFKVQPYKRRCCISNKDHLNILSNYILYIIPVNILSSPKIINENKRKEKQREKNLDNLIF